MDNRMIPLPLLLIPPSFLPIPCPLQEFRHRVRRELEKSGALWHFSRSALDEAGARHGPPFAIIGSNTMDLTIGR